MRLGKGDEMLIERVGAGPLRILASPCLAELPGG